MSIAQVAPDRRPSPLLSNNPFRKRIGSGPTSPAFPPESDHRKSTNPFLDDTETAKPESSAIGMVVSGGRDTSQSKKQMTENTRELFNNLNINNKSEMPREAPRRAPPPPGKGVPPRRPENMPPRPFGRMPPPQHRPSASEEDRKVDRSKPRGALGELDIFADPPDPNKPRERRPRRNSESSVREKSGKYLDPEEEKKRRERRQRESRRKPKPPSHRLDIIDKLDVTSIYGMGLFHHDGPFDACNPSRNRKNSKQAPMQAFPKDSRNMQLGGSGPNNAKLNLDQIHGTGMEAHIDYNDAHTVDPEYVRPKTSGQGAVGWDPTARTEPLHGDETAGLGTSTFLEGAPASRAAIQRRETEFEATQAFPGGGGLNRKKSLAQKIRGVRTNGNGRQQTSPEPIQSPTTPLGTGKSESAVNPFFKEYDNEYDRKGAQIAFAQEQERTGGRVRAPSSPRRGLGLERTKTSESMGDGEGKGGFMSRVKSIKGKASRSRIERRDTSG